jgi:hypothetical protein
MAVILSLRMEAIPEKGLKSRPDRSAPAYPFGADTAP